MGDTDQAARRPSKPGRPAPDWTLVDTRNTNRLKEIVGAYGWPGIRAVGDEAATDAFLIVQHAPDLAFQRRCMNLMEQAAAAGDASLVELAYLQDRIAVREGRKQSFGTQMCGGLACTPCPIDDAAHVDGRRKALGLPSMKEYCRLMREADTR